MSKLCFSYATLTTAGPWLRHAQALRSELPSRLGEGRVYAAFAPQFGLASDQLVVMTSWDDPEGGLPVHWHDHNVHAYLVEGTTDFLDAETGIRYNVGPWMHDVAIPEVLRTRMYARICRGRLVPRSAVRRTHLRSVSAEHPIFSAIEQMASHSEPYSLPTCTYM